MDSIAVSDFPVVDDEEEDDEPYFDMALEDPIAVMGRGKDISEFAEMKKVAWEDRAERIVARFPTVKTLDWAAALDKDIDLFGRIIRDVLKLEQAVPGRPGPRPSLETNSAIRRMQQLLGNDFTLEPFHVALTNLRGERSVRAMAHKCNLDRNTLYRLMHGTLEPDGFHMRMVAEGFNRHPSYFLEWRILYIVASLVRRFEWSPETSVAMFRRLDMQRKMRTD